ncbi:MAG: hypothetical protein ACM3MG_13125 [Bacillota bacterium]
MVVARSIIATLAAGTLLFGFQNCSKVGLNEVAFSDASLQTVQTVSTPEVPVTGVNDNSGNVDISNPAPSTSPSTSTSTSTSPSPSTSTSDGQVSNGDGDKDQSKSHSGSSSCSHGSANNSHESSNSSDEDASSDVEAHQLVECELSGSKSKVVLGTGIAIGSNAQTSRICMSENACLNLINEYAVSHDCSLTPGAATSPSSNGVQCSAVFPGSKGTCKNAKILSDADVSALLTKLGK